MRRGYGSNINPGTDSATIRGDTTAVYGLPRSQRAAAGLDRIQKGNFSARMPIEHTGVAGKIADTVNEIIDLEQRICREQERVSVAVGKDGKVSHRAMVEGAVGSWAASVGTFNSVIGDLVRPASETVRVLGAIARGDLTQTMALEVEGRPLEGEFLH